MKGENRRRISAWAGWAAVLAAVVWVAGVVLIPRDVQASIAAGWNTARALVFVVALVVWSLTDRKLWGGRDRSGPRP